MSWLISEAMMKAYGSLPCSPERAEEYSPDKCSDGEQSAPSNGKPTQRAYLQRDKTTDTWSRFPSGMTCEPLTEADGEAVLMSFLAAFHAKTSAQPGKGQESKASDPACGWKWPESSVKYDPDSRSWKTRQCSVLGGLEEFSETWPRWGSMRNGECWEQTPWERRTEETASGLWPTPNVPNGGRSLAHVTDWSESGRTAYHKGKKVQVGLESAVKMWPTPISQDAKHSGHAKSGPGKAMKLSYAVVQWPTPSSNNGTGGATGLAGGSGNRKKLYRMLGEEEGKKLGCQSLNPNWVEWLMGWPIGFTALKPLETAKSPSARLPRSSKAVGG